MSPGAPTSVRSAPTGPGGGGGRPVLEVSGLSVRYGGVVAVDDVSVDVGDGEIVGLIGPNGAGKTSWIDAVTGFHRPSGGRVRFAGRDVTDVSPHTRAQLGFVRTFQRLDLFEDLTVRQNLLVGASTPAWRDTLLDALWPRRRDEAGVDEALALVGLEELADRRPTELSNGQRHLVALGRALAARPRLVLLDEPAAGLDDTESAALGVLLREVRDRGTAVLLVDHDMALVMTVCDRLAVLDLGRCIAAGTPAEVRANRDVVAAYLGTDTRHDEASDGPVPPGAPPVGGPVADDAGRDRDLDPPGGSGGSVGPGAPDGPVRPDSSDGPDGRS